MPPTLRLVHVHGALIGGVAQLILGALLSFIPPLFMTGRNRSDSHPFLFGLINVGTMAVLFGFAMQRDTVVGIAGVFIVIAFLSVFAEGLRRIKHSLISPPLNVWFYGVAFIALLVGLGVGEAMAWQVIPMGRLGQVRLAHIHLNLLGFVTVTIIGTMHNLFPTAVNTPLHSSRLARVTFLIVPAAVLLLVVGFLLGNVTVQIGAGSGLFIGVGLYAYNMLRTWFDAGRPRGAVSDHFLLATFFLVLAVVTGMLVSANALSAPPAVPFGTLHLIAYTHLALLGFAVQTIIAALSHHLPITVALARAPSNKKRGPYLKSLLAIVEAWHALQAGALNLGTVGLALVATLVWQFSLGSMVVQITAWVAAALLCVGLGVFTVKVCLLLASRPPD